MTRFFISNLVQVIPPAWGGYNPKISKELKLMTKGTNSKKQTTMEDIAGGLKIMIENQQSMNEALTKVFNSSLIGEELLTEPEKATPFTLLELTKKKFKKGKRTYSFACGRCGKEIMTKNGFFNAEGKGHANKNWCKANKSAVAKMKKTYGGKEIEYTK